MYGPLQAAFSDSNLSVTIADASGCSFVGQTCLVKLSDRCKHSRIPIRAIFQAPVRGLYEACTRLVRGLYEKHLYFKMLVTFEPNVAQRSVASQNDHKSKACLPEASNTAFTMYRRLKRRLRRLYEAPFLAPFFWRFNNSNLHSKQTKFSVKNIFLLTPDSGSSAWYPQAEGSQGRGSCRVQLVQHDLVDRPIVCICKFTCCVNITFPPLSSCFHGYLVHLSHGLSAVFS